jgi:hypothetical protein
MVSYQSPNASSPAAFRRRGLSKNTRSPLPSATPPSPRRKDEARRIAANFAKLPEGMNNAQAKARRSLVTY